MKLPYKLIITSIFCIAWAAIASALEPSAYTTESLLAKGRWVKVSVPVDGLYAITAQNLRTWGFSDINRVIITGYGGHRQSDVLNKSTYVDDLPQVPAVLDGNTLVFYGHGGGEWREISGSLSYYRTNDYSSNGYYFVGEAPEGVEPLRPAESAVDNIAEGTEFTRSFTQLVQHELEITPMPGEAGPLLLGENFSTTTTRRFTLETPDGLAGPASLRTSFVSTMTTIDSRLSFKVNGKALAANSSDKVTTISGSEYVYASETVSSHTFDNAEAPAATSSVEITFTPSGSHKGAWLNYLTLGYTRSLSIPRSGHLVFYTRENNLELSNAENAKILEVSNPAQTKLLRTAAAGTSRRMSLGGRVGRTLAAWTSTASMPSPKFAGVVTNQNLHADSGYDMVIVACSSFADDAQRLADYHASSSDSLKVKIVDPEKIYNEFSSGKVDPGALRRYFKMLYDRGQTDGRPLRYALLFGRITLDNRRLTVGSPRYPTLPSWMPASESASMSDNTGYCTDDIMAMLADGSGASPGTDKLSIAIGRIPVTDAADATSIVDKLLQYANFSPKTSWKHRFLFLADDQDGNAHLKQTEDFIKGMTANESDILVRKLYMDAYPMVGGSYPEARNAMFRYLEEGVVWWNYIGHANTTGWTHEHLLTYTDLNSMYLRHWPFIYAATCDFMRFDSRNLSGGEILFLERNGGAIGIISAIRPVGIYNNGMLSEAMGRALGQRDAMGRIPTPGEVCRKAKNDIYNDKGETINDTNRLRYFFVGDPALRLAVPDNHVEIDSINGLEADIELQPTLAALSQTTISGHISSRDGSLLSDFNGTLLADIFDAERTVTTYGNGKNGIETNYEDFGSRIYSGSAKVNNGRFELKVAMPMEISQNFRPATMSLYAFADSDNREASGTNRSFYVYGFDESAEPDTIAPTIEYMVLNNDEFVNGDNVNTDPMLIARISDNVGINLSSAGVGHQMTARLDGNKSFMGLSDYSTPDSDGTPGGVINYTLEGLTEGHHALELHVWDTSGNVSKKEIEFYVQPGLAPKLYDVYSDANPASTVANFYLKHNRPESMATVTITVYNLLGRPLWSKTVTGRSDMFLTVPVSWDLCDNAGRRVNRGIYLYQASITTDGQSYTTASRRLAVTAQ